MRIGLCGGSFDPVHIGHLILARDAMEQLGLDRIIFLPAALSPHKLNSQPLPPELRLQLLQAAISDEPGFSADPREMRRPAPSFAIDSVRELQAELPDADFFYLIGEDNLEKLSSWKEYEELRERVRFAVFARAGHIPDCPFPTIIRRIEISSTEIRNRIAAGLSVRYLVPDVCAAMISSQRLYAS